jgi:long-chain acyl-CoA synthetase
VIVTASGLNIYPDDLEAALLRQPGIKAVTVVETTGANGSEPLAALVMQGGMQGAMQSAGDPAAAVRAANQELAEYQQIRRWVVWPEPDLPRTSTGKVMRSAVAAALRNAPRSKGAPGGGTLAGLIGRITGEDIAQLADSASLSEDFHLDSLGRVELQSAIEGQFGVNLDDAEYQQVRTLGELKSLATHSGASRDESVYPLWPWTRLQSAIRFLFIEAVLRPLVAVLAAPRVISDLQELSNPVLLVANHVTTYDVPLILYALPRRMRHRVAVAMAGEMLLDWRHARGQGNFFLNLVAPIQYFLVTGLFNVFPMPQRTDFRKSFAHAGRAMDTGFHVLVFPEGRRTPDGLMHPFRGGAGILWKELGTKAVPVYLAGLGGPKWFRSNRIAIHVGKPITLSPGIDAAEAARVLEDAVRKMGA